MIIINLIILCTVIFSNTNKQRGLSTGKEYLIEDMVLVWKSGHNYLDDVS